MKTREINDGLYDFSRFMDERFKQIENGSLGRPNRKAHLHYAAAINSRHPDRIDLAIKDYARAERDDPFARVRARHYFSNGIAELDSYNMGWRKEPRSIEAADRTIVFDVEVPINRRQP